MNLKSKNISNQDELQVLTTRKDDNKLQANQKSFCRRTAGMSVMFLSSINYSLLMILAKHLFNTTNISPCEMIYFRSIFLFTMNSIIICFSNIASMKIQKKDLPDIMIRCGGGSSGLICVFYANKYLPLSIAQTIVNIYPILTAIIGFIVLKERITKYDILGIIFSFSGMLCIVLSSNTSSNSVSFDIIYLILPLMGALGAGFGYVYTRKINLKYSFMVPPFYASVTGGIAASVLIMIDYQVNYTGPRNFTWDMMGLIFLLGVFGGLGQILMSKAYQLEKAARVTVINYMQLIYNFLADHFLFRVYFHILVYLGAFLILFANVSLTILKGLQKI